VFSSILDQRSWYQRADDLGHAPIAVAGSQISTRREAGHAGTLMPQEIGQMAAEQEASAMHNLSRGSMPGRGRFPDFGQLHSEWFGSRGRALVSANSQGSSAILFAAVDGVPGIF